MLLSYQTAALGRFLSHRTRPCQRAFVLSSSAAFNTRYDAMESHWSAISVCPISARSQSHDQVYEKDRAVHICFSFKTVFINITHQSLCWEDVFWQMHIVLLLLDVTELCLSVSWMKENHTHTHTHTHTHREVLYAGNLHSCGWGRRVTDSFCVCRSAPSVFRGFLFL